MQKTELRRFLSVMEFFYGFLFGVAILGAALTFLITPSFFLAVLLAACVFAFFTFLTAIVRYCIMRIKIADESLQIAKETQYIQEQMLQEQVVRAAQNLLYKEQEDSQTNDSASS